MSKQYSGDKFIDKDFAPETPTDPPAASLNQSDQIEALTEWLADRRIWPWLTMMRSDDAACCVLRKMADLQLISWRQHRWGGDVWTVNGQDYGRTED